MLLLLVGLLCAFGVALALLTAHQRRQGQFLIRTREAEVGQLFRRLTELLSEPLNNFAYDYTYWDEMVRFVETGDPAWGVENLKVPMPTFGAHALWVYRTDGSLVYYASADDTIPAWDVEAWQRGASQLFKDRRLVHFYGRGPGGVWEIAGATIHPGPDVQRETSPRGYFLVGRCLSQGTLQDMSDLLGGDVSTVDAPSVGPSPSWFLRHELRFWHRLLAWDGTTLGFMEARVPLYAVQQMRRSAIVQLVLGGLFAGALLILVGWALHAWVTVPLRTVAASLDSGASASLVALAQRPDEFSHIAGLIRRFHDQHRELQNEVGQRQRAERDLLRNLDFERLMASISTRFVSCVPEALDTEIESALQRLGTFAGADQVHILEFTTDRRNFSCTHEWCREGVAPARQHLQGLVADAMPWGFARLQQGDVVMVDRVCELPAAAAPLRAALEADGVCSLLRVPMLYAGTAFGCIGFNVLRAERQWTDVLVRQLRFAAEILGNALQHRHAETRRRQLEDDLGHARQIESLGRLAGGVAHDLNNLLVPVMGYADILRDELPSHHPLRPDVDCIRRAALQARGLTQQLLAFARRQVLELQVLDLGAEVELFRDILRRLIPENIEICLRTAPGLGRVRADPTQIRQILMNLVLNARDAMPNGGQVTITVGSQEFDEAYATDHPEVRPGPYVMLAVSDTGTGMDEMARQHLFEPFFTTKAPGKGTGLGLATVHGIVTQHGGHVTVASAPGCGTAVSVYLPCVPADGPEPSDPPAPAPPSQGVAHVLLVEDADGVRDFVGRVLPSFGFRVTSASTPEAALQVARTVPDRIDILLTDVVMPGLNGRELYQALCQARPALKVLYMSGYPADAIAPQGVLAPGVHFLAKPFSAEDLVAALRQALAPT